MIGAGLKEDLSVKSSEEQTFDPSNQKINKYSEASNFKEFNESSSEMDLDFDYTEITNQCVFKKCTLINTEEESKSIFDSGIVRSVSKSSEKYHVKTSKDPCLKCKPHEFPFKNYKNIIRTEKGVIIHNRKILHISKTPNHNSKVKSFKNLHKSSKIPKKLEDFTSTDPTENSTPFRVIN